MAKTKIYSNEGQKVKELSGPIIRGKKYPAGTIVTNDPNDPRLKTYQDSLRLFNLGKRKEKEAIGEFNSRYPNEEIIHHYELPPYDITSRQYKSMSSIQPIGIYGTGIPANLSNNYTDKDDMTFPVYKKPVQPIVFNSRESAIPKMTSKGMPIPTVTPNERLIPDVVYKDNNVPNAAYNKGIDIYHRTDGLGRWAAQLIMSTQPGIRGRISTPNPKGNYTKIYKYK